VNVFVGVFFFFFFVFFFLSLGRKERNEMEEREMAGLLNGGIQRSTDTWKTKLLRCPSEDFGITHVDLSLFLQGRDYSKKKQIPSMGDLIWL
jgi:hypothetical protein